MGNALGLTTFETIETISGWNFVALNIVATKWWASQWFQTLEEEISEDTILAMRFMGIFLAFGRSFQYLTNTSQDVELKYKGYMLSGIVWIASAMLVVLHWNVIDPVQAYTNLAFYLAMGGGFFLQAPNLLKDNDANKKKE